MKTQFLAIFLVAEASHFRAGSLSYIQGDPGFLQVIRTQAWRHKKAGYGKEGCSREHAIRRQSVNVQNKLDECYLQDKNLTECESLPSRYTVTDIEKDQSEDQNYCYGYQVDSFYRPEMAFFIEYKACCWVDFKSDKDR